MIIFWLLFLSFYVMFILFCLILQGLVLLVKILVFIASFVYFAIQERRHPTLTLEEVAVAQETEPIEPPEAVHEPPISEPAGVWVQGPEGVWRKEDDADPPVA